MLCYLDQIPLTGYQVDAQYDWLSRDRLTIYTRRWELVNHALKMVSTIHFRGLSDKKTFFDGQSVSHSNFLTTVSILATVRQWKL